MADPRNNADDAYAAFMGMGESEWHGLLRSMLSGACLQPEEDKGFRRALAERRPASPPPGVPSIPDYSGEEIVAPTPDKLKQLGQLVAKQGLLELEIEDLEAQLKLKKKEADNYAENLVPALMAEIGMAYVKTMGGLEVELKESIRASIPQDPAKREAAFGWLHETGNDGIIKREITVRYGRDEGKFADDLMNLLKDNGVYDHAQVEHEWNIHNSTLVSFLKSELAAGHNVPLEAFGAFIQKRARIKRRG